MEMMVAHGRALGAALAIGTVASLTSTLALGLLARLEGKGALQPINATSHWLNGHGSGSLTGADITHTAVGYITHHAATVFWAAFFVQWLGARRSRTPLSIVQGAVALSAIAAAVDYVATPKRFTPGWELVLTRCSMATAYAAMAAGMAAGALMTQQSPDAEPRRFRTAHKSVLSTV